VPPILQQPALLKGLYGLCNPLHSDSESAAAAGFPWAARLACVQGAIVDTILDGDVGGVRPYGARFAGVVFSGQTVKGSGCGADYRLTRQAPMSADGSGSRVAHNHCIVRRMPLARSTVAFQSRSFSAVVAFNVMECSSSRSAAKLCGDH
jgi:acyl dehydratase